MNNDAKPSISWRVSIKWGDEEPSERTSTLVLTSPKGCYVDMRVVDGHAVSKEPESIEELEVKYNWIFAGMSHKHTGGRASWDHWVDSRTDALSEDSGVMSPLPNGDTLERGSMINDEGIKLNYEEVWHDEEVPPSEGTVTVLLCLRDIDPANASDQEASVKADVESLSADTGADDGSPYGLDAIERERVCGMVIRVGRWCQGILKIEGAFLAERWEQQAAENDEWTCVYRLGDASVISLPCSYAINGISGPITQTLEGKSVLEGTRRWRFVEACGNNS